jgi:hypothetical protein
MTAQIPWNAAMANTVPPRDPNDDDDDAPEDADGEAETEDHEPAVIREHDE